MTGYSANQDAESLKKGKKACKITQKNLRKVNVDIVRDHCIHFLFRQTNWLISFHGQPRLTFFPAQGELKLISFQISYILFYILEML